MVKSYWWWLGAVVVAHVIIVSAQSKELGFWVFKTWSDLGLSGTGDWGLGLGLDNVTKNFHPSQWQSTLTVTSVRAFKNIGLDFDKKTFTLMFMRLFGDTLKESLVRILVRC